MRACLGFAWFVASVHADRLMKSSLFLSLLIDSTPCLFQHTHESLGWVRLLFHYASVQTENNRSSPQNLFCYSFDLVCLVPLGLSESFLNFCFARETSNNNNKLLILVPAGLLVFYFSFIFTASFSPPLPSFFMIEGFWINDDIVELRKWESKVNKGEGGWVFCWIPSIS